MDYFYGVSTFAVTETGGVKALATHQSLDAELVLDRKEHDENIWDADIKLEVFVNEDGIGFDYEVPAGYSEYTYDPDNTKKFYFTHDVEWFLKFGLDEECRSMLHNGDSTLLVLAIQKLKGKT